MRTVSTGEAGMLETPFLDLSIVVPAHNEEKRLGAMLDAYLPFFTERLPGRFEILVVVNGSTDATAALVRRYAAEWPSVRLLEEPEPIGKGGAVMLGLRASGGRSAGYVDADGATPPSAFLDLFENVKSGCPVAVASRWTRGATVSPPQSPLRRIASRVFNLCTRILFGLRLKDTQCGAKVFDRSSLDLLIDGPAIITRWAFDVDILYRLRRAGILIREVPTVWRDVAGSKLRVTETSLEMFAALIRLRLMYSRAHQLVRFYDRFLVGENASEESLRRGLLTGLGNQTANAINLAFQILAARVLLSRAEGSAHDYGNLAAILGLAILVRSLHGDGPRSSESLDRNSGWGRGWTWGIELGFWGLAYGQSRALAGVLQMDDAGYVRIGLLLGLAHIIYSRYMNALSASHAFRSAAAVQIAQSLLRFLLAGGLLATGMGVGGALYGTLAGAMAGALLARWAAQPLAPVRPSPDDLSNALPAITASGWRRTLPLTAFTMLGIVDILLMKIRFSPAEAGEYALAGMMARMAFFLPMPIVALTLSRAFGTEDPVRWKKCMATLAVVLLIPATLMILAADVWVAAIAGVAPEGTTGLMRMLTVAYLPLAPMLALLRYRLSRFSSPGIAVWLTPSLAALLFAALVFSPYPFTRMQLAAALALINAFTLIVMAAGARRGRIPPAVSR